VLHQRGRYFSGFIISETSSWLQQLGARYPNFEYFAAGKSDYEIAPTAAIIVRAHHTNFHLALNPGNLAMVGDREAIIERTQRSLVLIVKSHASYHLKSPPFALALPHLQ
jgi:hypothetical protein